MQPDQPLLTIAIPTYNREPYLKTLMSILEPQVLNESRIEVIISDNASKDGTQYLARSFASKSNTFRYIKNEINLGADGNILQCFEQAQGQYVWILGDDDVIAPDAIRKIMAYLEPEEFDLIYISSFSFEGTPDFGRRPKCKDPSRITDVRIFVSKINVFYTFISGNIVNKKRLLTRRPMDFTPLVGTSLVQLGWMYAALNSYACGLYVHERLVGARTNNTGGYKLLKTFGPNLKNITESLLEDKALQNLMMNGTLMRFWPTMLMGYRDSSSAFEQEGSPRKILGPAFRENFRYWLFVYPILRGSRIFAKGWFLLTRFVNILDKALGYPLLR